MVIELLQLQEGILSILIILRLQDLIITQVTDHLTLMLHHHLHLDILDMVDQEDIMAGKQKKVVLARPFSKLYKAT